MVSERLKVCTCTLVCRADGSLNVLLVSQCVVCVLQIEICGKGCEDGL